MTRDDQRRPVEPFAEQRPSIEQNADERRIRSRVRALRGLYIHAIVYVAVNIGLLFIDLLSSPGKLWFFYPLLGWGIGLACHAAALHLPERWLGEEWEARKVAELQRRESR